MKMVYVVIQWFKDSYEDPEIVGVYSSLKLAKSVVKEMDEWDPKQCDIEDLFWGNDETSVLIVAKEIDE